jgi:hypothetical protein
MMSTVRRNTGRGGTDLSSIQRLQIRRGHTEYPAKLGASADELRRFLQRAAV